MNELNDDWEYAYQQILKEPDAIAPQQPLHYENDKRIEKIRYQEELNQAKAITSVCEKRVKEMKLLMNKMERDLKEEKNVAIEEALHHVQYEEQRRKEEEQPEPYESDEFDDNESFKTAEESLHHLLPYGQEEEEDQEEEDQEDIVQVMKRHNSWMFNVLEDERDVDTSTDACGGGTSIRLKKKPSLPPIVSNPAKDSDEEKIKCNPYHIPEKKVELQQILQETTTNVQQLLYQLQALLSAVSHDAINAARIEKEEALQQARVQHLKNMEVALDSTVRSAAEEKKLIIKEMKAKHKVELATVRLNAEKAKDNEKERKKKENGSNQGSSQPRNKSITSFLSPSTDTASKSTQENALLSTKRALYRAEMEAALRGASVSAKREKEDALYKARVEHAAVLETVLARAAAAEKRSQDELSKALSSVTTAPIQPIQQVLTSPPSTTKSILDTNGETWVKKEEVAVKVRLALKQAVDISNKANKKIEKQRKRILKMKRSRHGDSSNVNQQSNQNHARSSRKMDGAGTAAKNSMKGTIIIEEKRKVSVAGIGMNEGVQAVPAVA